VADDHMPFLGFTVRLLEPEFAVVKTVNDGRTLLEEVTLLKPDVVIVDISLPVLNGLEAARPLRTAGSTAKIVFLTVHRDPEYVQAALAAGAQGYVAVVHREGNSVRARLRGCARSSGVNLEPAQSCHHQARQGSLSYDIAIPVTKSRHSYNVQHGELRDGSVRSAHTPEASSVHSIEPPGGLSIHRRKRLNQ
jgi:CheY-like chemotaxis protein